MVIQVKIFKTEKTIEIHLVWLTEVCSKVLGEKYSYKYKSVKTALSLSNVVDAKQLFVYKQRPFYISFMGFNWHSSSIS